MRAEISHLVGKRIRVTGEIKKVMRGRSKKHPQYQVTLGNVHVDQSREVIDHINIFLPKESTSPEVLKLLWDKDYPIMTFTGEVRKYVRPVNEMGIKTVDYGITKLRKIEYKSKKGEK